MITAFFRLKLRHTGCVRDTRRHRRLSVMGNMTYSRTIECAPPTFGHTVEHTARMDLRAVSSRASVPAMSFDSPQRWTVDDDLAVRLTWLAYAVALSSFGLVLGVGIGLLLVPSAPLAFVRL